MKPKVLITRALFPDVVARLAEHFDVDLNAANTPLTRSQLAARLADKDGVLVMGDRLDETALRGAPRLRVVSNMAVGYDNLELAAFDRANVLATNTPGVLDESVADYAWALMMNAARRVSESERWLRRGEWRGWSYDMYLGGDVHGSILGIIGMGRIGEAVARRAQGFGMSVLYFNRSRVSQAAELRTGASYCSKEQLLHRADHVILTLPYTPESRHIIGAKELTLMKSTATLTNVARGGVVDDAALLLALRERRIAAAALDVYENEPNFLPGLLELPNLVMTPHNAPGSERTRRAMANLAADNLIAGLGFGPDAGHPPNPINLKLPRGAH